MWSHINKVEDERLMIISVGAENVFIKNEHSFMIKKIIDTEGVQGMYFVIGHI